MFSLSGETSVETTGNLLHVYYGNCFGGGSVESHKKPRTGDIFRCLKMGYLPQGVNASIGAGSAEYLRGGLGHCRNGRFQNFLDGGPVFLTLPAAQPGTVVLDS